MINRITTNYLFNENFYWPTYKNQEHHILKFKGKMKIIVTNFLPVLLLQLAITSSKEIGQLEDREDHGIGGIVHFDDNENSIIIKQFQYDGKCGEAFFMAGVDGLPSSSDSHVLKYTSDGVTYSYANIPSLEESSLEDDKEIKLTLPDTTLINDLKWLSVWCKSKEIDLGSIIFQQSLSDTENDISFTNEETNEDDKTIEDNNDDEEKGDDDEDIQGPLESIDDRNIVELHDEHDTDLNEVSEAESVKDDPQNAIKSEESTNLEDESTVLDSIIKKEDDETKKTKPNDQSVLDFVASKLDETIRFFNIISIVAWFDHSL